MSEPEHQEKPGTPVAASPPLVDCHAHVLAHDMPLAPDAWMVPDYDFTGNDYLATLDAHGVRYGVLSALSISGFFNDFTLAAVADQPRLRATVNLPTDISARALEDMARKGAVGMRLQLVRNPVLPDLAGAAYQRLFATIRDLGWHVHIAIEGQRLPLVLPALEASGVRIAIDHFGHPEPELRLSCPGLAAAVAAAERGHVWIKISAGFRLNGPDSWKTQNDAGAEEFADEVAAFLLAEVGPERLMWGSDCPFVGYEGRVSYGAAVERYGCRVPRESDRRQIDETAYRFYFSRGLS